MVLILVVLIVLCIILIKYSDCIKLQLGSIIKQLIRMRKEKASNPVLIEIMDKSIVLMTPEINKNLFQEAVLRASQEINEYEFKQFITNISYCIRAPFTIIKGYLQLLQRTGPYNSSNKYMEMCVGHTIETEKRIKQFFQYAYWSGMEEEISMRKVNITNFVTDIITKFIPEFEKKNIRVKLDNKEVYFVIADTDLLSRVMNNFLKNSLRYAKGDVEISIIKPDEFMQVQLKNKVKRGCPTDSSKVFEHFYIGKKAGKGLTALWLAIARLLIERMGGEVFARMEGEMFCIGFMLKAVK